MGSVIPGTRAHAAEGPAQCVHTPHRLKLCLSLGLFLEGRGLPQINKMLMIEILG